jgi:hypothetical protein
MLIGTDEPIAGHVEPGGDWLGRAGHARLGGGDLEPLDKLDPVDALEQP